MINFHQVEATKSLVFKEGGYPLGYDQGKPEITSKDKSEMAAVDGKLTFIKNLYGYTTENKAQSFNDDINGSNVRYNQSVVPSLGYENKEPGKFYLASMVCGRVSNETIDQIAGLLTQFSVKENQAEMKFYDGEEAFMQVGEIKDVSLSLNGKSFSGKIVAARVSQDGTKSFVLFEDGTIQN